MFYGILNLITISLIIIKIMLIIQNLKFAKITYYKLLNLLLFIFFNILAL